MPLQGAGPIPDIRHGWHLLSIFAISGPIYPTRRLKQDVFVSGARGDFCQLSGAAVSLTLTRSATAATS
jgi:hypothetical protein